jgi:polyhydroxyalkanoate synthesis regulator phasin
MKDPMIRVSKDVKLLPSRSNEMLMSVKTNNFREVTCGKYTTTTSRVAFDGVRATPRQIKIISPKETPKRLAPALMEREEKHQRTTVAALEKRIDLLTQTVTTLQEKTNALTRIRASLAKEFKK